MTEENSYSLSNEVEVLITNSLCNQSFDAEKINCTVEINYYEKEYCSVPDINHKKIKQVLIDDTDINTWLSKRDEYDVQFTEIEIIEIIQEFIESVLNYTNKNIIEIIKNGRVII